MIYTFLDQRGRRKPAQSGQGQEIGVWRQPHCQEVQQQVDGAAGRAAGAWRPAAGHTGQPAQLTHVGLRVFRLVSYHLTPILI